LWGNFQNDALGSVADWVVSQGAETEPDIPNLCRHQRQRLEDANLDST